MAGWSIWKARNEFIFQNSPIVIKNIALKMEQAWDETQSLMIKQSDKQTCCHNSSSSSGGKWQPPVKDKVKFNCDASWRKESKEGFGAVVMRNHKGELIDGRKFKVKGSSVLVCEALALREACLMARSMNLHEVQIESDNKELIQLSVSESDPPWECASIIRDIRTIVKDFNLLVSWIPRAFNGVAHWVASFVSGLLPQNWIRYRLNAPLVLKGITCTFREGDRVGVVGRTGSGKTTLISALFRLVEPDSGKILIDGLDICSIGLKDLRLKLSIIPQEPTLFRGSVRTNLDPLGLYFDDEIWKALEKCQLKVTISSLPKLLDSSVSEEGENWSAGQRQLFCLGRVLLKRNRILVLDEATASIDSATDAILQSIIREEFSDCTVITVAHRVPTVIDSNMVMVLSFGKLIEYDEPSKLLETNSSFSKLVAEYWSSCRRN